MVASFRSINHCESKFFLPINAAARSQEIATCCSNLGHTQKPQCSRISRTSFLPSPHLHQFYDVKETNTDFSDFKYRTKVMYCCRVPMSVVLSTKLDQKVSVISSRKEFVVCSEINRMNFNTAVDLVWRKVGQPVVRSDSIENFLNRFQLSDSEFLLHHKVY